MTGADAVGNTSTITSTYVLRAPNAPGVSVTSPGNSTNVTWTLVPEIGASSMSATLTGPSVAPLTTALGGGDTSFTTALAPANEGDWTLSVTATVDGRTSPAGVATYVLDTTSPNLTVSAVDASTPTQPAWTVSVDEPVTPQCRLTGTTAAGASYDSGATACPTGYTAPTLAEGSYTLTVTASDAAGNAAVPVTRFYTYDTTSPGPPGLGGPLA